MIYLDHAATTPMSEKALKTYLDTAQHVIGNSQSVHDSGTTAARLLDMCRDIMAKSFGGHKNGVVFTSGGTESNILAVDTLLASTRGRHIISTKVEHASMRNYLNKLAGQGYRVTFLPVNANGLIDLADLEQAITDDTALVTIQFVNSEIGTIQPLAQIGKLLAPRGILFHSDAVQAFGKLPFNVEELGLHSFSVSSHKLYGPKGMGLCYLSPNIRRRPYLPGTTHEMGFRPGTVNLPAVAAFTTATQERLEHMSEELAFIRSLRQRFLEILGDSVQEAGSSRVALPHILGITLPHTEGQHAMLRLSRMGIMVAVGSACHVDMEEPSHTLLAIGKTAPEAKTFIRVSFGKDNTLEQVEQAAEALLSILLP